MIGILENTRATLKKGMGIFGILVIWWKGLFCNIIKEMSSFAKRARERGWTLKGIVRRAGGLGKSALFFLSPATETGEGEEASPAAPGR